AGTSGGGVDSIGRRSRRPVLPAIPAITPSTTREITARETTTSATTTASVAAISNSSIHIAGPPPRHPGDHTRRYPLHAAPSFVKQRQARIKRISHRRERRGGR